MFDEVFLLSAEILQRNDIGRSCRQNHRFSFIENLYIYRKHVSQTPAPTYSLNKKQRWEVLINLLGKNTYKKAICLKEVLAEFVELHKYNETEKSKNLVSKLVEGDWRENSFISNKRWALKKSLEKEDKKFKNMTSIRDYLEKYPLKADVKLAYTLYYPKLLNSHGSKQKRFFKKSKIKNSRKDCPKERSNDRLKFDVNNKRFSKKRRRKQRSKTSLLRFEDYQVYDDDYYDDDDHEDKHYWDGDDYEVLRNEKGEIELGLGESVTREDAQMKNDDAASDDDDKDMKRQDGEEKLYWDIDDYWDSDDYEGIRNGEVGEIVTRGDPQMHNEEDEDDIDRFRDTTETDTRGFFLEREGLYFNWETPSDEQYHGVSFTSIDTFDFNEREFPPITEHVPEKVKAESSSSDEAVNGSIAIAFKDMLKVICSTPKK